MRRSLLALFTALVIILFSPIVNGASGEKPQTPMAGAPNISIVLDQDEVTATVEPGDDGRIRFTGTVYCELPPSTPPGQYCVVTLTADAGGWPVSNPPSMAFSRTYEQEDFYLDIQIPIETSQMTQGQLSVSGRWSYSPGAGGGTIPPATAIINVGAYSRPFLESDSKNNTFPVGKWAEIPIDVTNVGNANDDIALEITNIPDGIEAYLLTDEIHVPEKQTKVIKMKVRQSSGSPRINKITVVGKGSNGGRKEEDQHTVVIETTVSAKSLITTPYVVGPFILILLGAGITGFLIFRKRRKMKGKAIV